VQKLALEPSFDVYICENGGASAFDALISALIDNQGPCKEEPASEILSQPVFCFVRLRHLQLRRRKARVFVAEAEENLGYAGAINAWLHVLLTYSAWPGIWILNPDTQPQPSALAELVAWSTARRKGMVGSRVVRSPGAEYGFNRGLRWRPILATTAGVDKGTPIAVAPDPDNLEARLDAVSGASVYVTRECLETIGLMDERYFLYFEDLDWGYRTKDSFGLGYAHGSVVVHGGGTTIGTAARRSKTSPLSVYLDFRNRVHFVREHHPFWIGWTLLMLLIRSFEYGMAGSLTNMSTALRGVYAGIAGETGRPDRVFDFDAGTPRLRKRSNTVKVSTSARAASELSPNANEIA
jgi:N-acetylglucosaminyl-diphospho-decaprenol L-rhamnosyltransferase